MVRFKISNNDREVIEQITNRGWALPWVRSAYESRTALLMDITETHLNAAPLRLDALLAADEFNFLHDLDGIAANLDRATGTLKNAFRPRFAA